MGLLYINEEVDCAYDRQLVCNDEYHQVSPQHTAHPKALDLCKWDKEGECRNNDRFWGNRTGGQGSYRRTAELVTHEKPLSMLEDHKRLTLAQSHWISLGALAGDLE